MQEFQGAFSDSLPSPHYPSITDSAAIRHPGT
jgi:hypothetical protein